MQDSDRGYATGSVDFHSDEVLDTSKAADFLCANCLNEILPLQIDRCCGVGAVNLATREVRIFEERLGGFTLGDFYIDCDLRDLEGDAHRMDILVFSCPIRLIGALASGLSTLPRGRSVYLKKVLAVLPQCQ